MMQWIAEHWWIFLLVLIGMFVNGIKALMRVDPKPYLDEIEKKHSASQPAATRQEEQKKKEEENR